MKNGIYFILMSLLVILFSCETETAPDLVPEKLIAVQSDTLPLETLTNRSPAMTLFVRNIGDEESVPCKTRVEYSDLKSQSDEVYTPAIQAGEQIKLHFTMPRGLINNYPGFIVTVDSEDEVYEKDETNSSDPRKEDIPPKDSKELHVGCGSARRQPCNLYSICFVGFHITKSSVTTVFMRRE